MKQLKEFLDRYLDYVRQNKPKENNCEVIEVMKKLFDLLKPLFKNELNFEIYLPVGSYRVPFNESEIKQVILNFVLNSRDAIFEKQQSDAKNKDNLISLIVLETTYEELKKYFPVRKLDENYVCIMVKDTGIGIKPEDQGKIFEIFFTTKPIGKGTGLGLASVKKLVESRNGFIRFESEFQKGANFYVYLPLLNDN